MTRGSQPGAAVARTTLVQVRRSYAGAAGLRSLSAPNTRTLQQEDEVEVPEDGVEVGDRHISGPTAVEPGEVWEVVGGSRKGGITVRMGFSHTSPKLEGLLSHSAKVRALEQTDGRIYYELLSGSGPQSGWVSIRFQGKFLMLPSGGGEGVKEAQEHQHEEEKEAGHEEDGVRLPYFPSKLGIIWKVVGGSYSGGIRVRTGWETSSPVLKSPLQRGALIREVECDAGRLRYELVEGSGPLSGWINRTFRGQKLLARRKAGSRRRVAPAPIPLPEAVRMSRSMDRDEGLAYNANQRADVASGDDATPGEGGTCWCCQCGLPIDGIQLRCRCPCPMTLADLENEEFEAQQQVEWALKRRLRAEYGIGWKDEAIPSNIGPLERLGCSFLESDRCCLVLKGGARQLEVAATREKEVSVNLEYLSLALKTGFEMGGQASFSLDMANPADPSSMLVKRIEPTSLAETSMGEVLFQADYYLKELAMGQFEQPVPGMKSCLESICKDGLITPWRARVWFVVLDAEVCLSRDNVLIPYVKMGVQAREQSMETGKDAPLTRPDHPLVRYAETFTLNFDAIAEKSRVIYSLREVAKASILAKFLQETRIPLQDQWFDLAGQPMQTCAEVPQLWNRCCYSRLSEQEGMLDYEEMSACDILVWGGVDLSLTRFQFSHSRIKLVPIELRTDDDTDSVPRWSHCSDTTDDSLRFPSEVLPGAHPQERQTWERIVHGQSDSTSSGTLPLSSWLRRTRANSAGVERVQQSRGFRSGNTNPNNTAMFRWLNRTALHDSLHSISLLALVLQDGCTRTPWSNSPKAKRTRCKTKKKR